MNTRNRGHVLTFRCVNCGSNEALAFHPSEHPVPADELRTKMYEAICTACGWKTTVCGVAALKIEFHASEGKTKAKAKGKGQR
jgi:hypothetical protein